MSQLLFGYLAAAIIILSILVISRRNPVHSVLFMLLMFFHLAALYLTLNAEFMAAVQVIVYAGAILVLFLFVVMLLNLQETIAEKRFMGIWPLGLLLVLALSFVIFTGISAYIPGPQGQYSSELIQKESHTVVLGKVLYTEYLFPFEVASLILLVAIVGAIVLAKKKSKS